MLICATVADTRRPNGCVGSNNPRGIAARPTRSKRAVGFSVIRSAPNDSYPRAPSAHTGSSTSALLVRLLDAGVIHTDEYDAQTTASRQIIDRETDDARLLDILLECKLLTEYQSARIKVGRL